MYGPEHPSECLIFHIGDLSKKRAAIWLREFYIPSFVFQASTTHVYFLACNFSRKLFRAHNSSSQLTCVTWTYYITCSDEPSSQKDQKGFQNQNGFFGLRKVLGAAKVCKTPLLLRHSWCKEMLTTLLSCSCCLIKAHFCVQPCNHASQFINSGQLPKCSKHSVLACQHKNDKKLQQCTMTKEIKKHGAQIGHNSAKKGFSQDARHAM